MLHPGLTAYILLMRLQSIIRIAGLLAFHALFGQCANSHFAVYYMWYYMLQRGNPARGIFLAEKDATCLDLPLKLYRSMSW